MDRRGFLATSGSAALLTACAPSRLTSTAPATLPRVKVAQNRIIRTVAGLRPYRAAAE